MKKSPIIKTTFRTRNPFFFFTYIYLGISIVIYTLCRFSQDFADFTSKYLGGAVRIFLAAFTSILPFSLAEGLVLLLVPVCIIFIFFAPDIDEGKYMSRNSYILLGVLFLVASMYLSVFAPAYFKTPVEDEMKLERSEVSKEDLVNAIKIVSDEIRKIEPKLTKDYTGKTLIPLSYAEMAAETNAAYSFLCDDYDFIPNFYSHPKPLAISNLMPSTRISGFYTFFTGEANISIAYPDFTLPYTMAHEMAHQRGFAKEDEANFIAFLVCTRSDNYYLRYSGYSEVLTYLLDDLYQTDYALYEEIFYTIPATYQKEYSAFISFLHSTYSENTSKVSNAINDTMLQSQGQAGSESYGLVTELVAAYYKNDAGEQ